MTTTHTAPRWALGGYARQYDWPQCRYCGRAQNHDCERVECLLCGTAQCHGNGLTCKVCHHGHLPGWSRTLDQKTCGYARCKGKAVAVARKRPVCHAHAAQIKVNRMPLTEYAARQVAHRDTGKGWEKWQLVP